MTPIVLIEIDENSRLRLSQTDGVRVGFVDRRVDGNHLTIFPETNDWDRIAPAIDQLQLLSPRRDDLARTAAETLRRLANGEVIVVKLLEVAP
jgi:hypothetical protein